MNHLRTTALPAVFCCVLIVLLAIPTAAGAQPKWTPDLSLKVKRLSDLHFSPDNKQLLYGINSVDVENDVRLTKYVVSDLTGDNVRTLLPPSPHISSAQWSPDGKSIAFLSSASGKQNIWIIDSGGGRATQITDLKQDVLSFKWAPNSKAIAFVMSDPAYIEPPVHDPTKFKRDHMWLLKLDEEDVSRRISNLTSKQTFTVSDWAGNWAYDWSPDSARIVFAYQEAPGLDSWTKAQLAVADVKNAQIKKVETGDNNWTYFPKYSPDGKWLAFINAPGEFKWSFLWDIKLLPVDGGQLTKLASTKNRLSFPWQWASDSQSIFYIENDRATYSFYRMPINGSGPKKVFGSPNDLNSPGLNTYLVSSMVSVDGADGKVAFIGQTYTSPPEVYVSDVEDFSPKRVSDVNAEFYDVPVGKTELVRWKSLDNTQVEGLLTYPVNYDESRKYPLVVQLHGGPNGADFNEYLPLMKFFATAAYSAKDYFVLRINYRGTLGYGRKFREDLIGAFGVLDYQDIMSGVSHVIDRGLVDPEQLFVVGQSNGGTLTSWIVTQTDRFKAACAIAGETDYISLEGTNGYFQTSWYLGGSFVDNLQRFLDRSPIFHVKSVKTPILLQGGLLDKNVPHTQLEEFYRALKRVGVDVRLVSYPNSNHDDYPPKLYLRLLRSCLDWTDKHRLGAPVNGR